jgi:hypothetical protein
MRLLSGIQRCFSSNKKRARSRTRLLSESLERRYALDAALPDAGGPDAGGHYAADASDGEALRFFLSEAGIGESPVVENPTIHMELGEIKTLYIWMQLPEGVGLWGAGVTAVSTTAGILQSAGISVYEPMPGSRWSMVIQPSNVPSLTPGDVLGQPAGGTLSPRDLTTVLEQTSDPSYDAATNSMLFGTVTVIAENVGATNIVLEVGTLAVAPWRADSQIHLDVPVYFGVGDDSVSGHEPLSTGLLADATVVVTGPAATAAVSDAYEFVVVAEDTVQVSASAGVLANDSVPAGSTVELVSPPRLGSLSLAADGSFQYVAPSMTELHPHWRGYPSISESFSYRVVTPSGTSSVASASLRLVAGVIANDDALTLDIHAEPKLSLTHKFLGNDAYFSQDPNLTWQFTSQPQHGTLSVYQDLWWFYTPEPGFIGQDSIEYEYSDGNTTATATIYIDVVNSNQAPVANDDTFTVTGPSKYIDGSTLLANDTDPDGDDLFTADLRIVDAPQHGTLQPGNYGSVNYIPTPGFSGVDTFTYVIKDRYAESLPATVTLNVTAVAPDDDDDNDSDDGPGEGGLGGVVNPPAAAPIPVQQGNRDRANDRDDRSPRDRDRGQLAAARPRATTARRASIDAAAVDQHHSQTGLSAGTRDERLIARRLRRT